MQKFRELIRAPLFSPLGFMARALLLAVLFGVCELAGWREHTTFISGTATSIGTGVNSSVTLGLIYMFAYFGFVLAAPILIIAALLVFVGRKFFHMASSPTAEAP
jgi:hypothetical protein